jgi:hypothetical protein
VDVETSGDFGCARELVSRRQVAARDAQHQLYF